MIAEEIAAFAASMDEAERTRRQVRALSIHHPEARASSIVVSGASFA